MPLPDQLTHPAVILALAAVMRAALAWQSDLTWPEYRTLHGIKRLTFPRLQRRFGHVVSFVNDKRGRTDDEYLTTVDADYRDVVRTLRDGGGGLHLISSVKRRPADHGDPLTSAHLVWDHGTDQTEAFLFRNDDETTDVYAHFEPSPETPREHLSGEHQQNGDPRGVVRDALGGSDA